MCVNILFSVIFFLRHNAKKMFRSLDVQRHAIAILFDVLHEFVSTHHTSSTSQEQQYMVISIMNSGISSAVQNAMENFSYCAEINLMSQKILMHLPQI
jgi:hypothetical protein